MSTMKSRNILTAVFICIGLNSFSQQTINGFSLPESVTSNGKRFFVSNQGQDVFSKDGDGFISEICEDGKLIELKFLSQKDVLNSPKGRNEVIIADENEITATTQAKHNILYNYGIIEAFVGGLYRGSLPIKVLKSKGHFGLGAPDMLDGELTMLDGKAYQTKSTGETVVLDNDHKTSFSSVTFFKSDTVFYVNNAIEQKNLLEAIENRLTNRNAMYAIKITGDFNNVRTRAFPPVKEEPFPVLSTILDRQQFFDIQNTAGTLVGYHLPEFLNGIQISGFHLHFLSADTKQGGHVLGFKGQNLKVEIAELKSFELEAPTTKDFQNFQFRKRHNEDLERVEQGK